MEEKNTTFILLAKPARVILWCPLSDFFFETIKRIGVFYFHWNDFLNFVA